MGTVLGFHVGTGSRNGYGQTAPLARGIIAFDGGGSMDEISEDCFVLYRPNNLYEWPPGSGGGLDDIMPGFDQLSFEDMEDQALYWWPVIKQRIDEVVAAHGRVDATKPTNEVAGNDPVQLRKLVEYEKHLGYQAHAEDYVLTMGNCATNSPHWDEGLWHGIIAPHIVEMWSLGHIYCRHAYADRVDGADRLIVNGQPAGDSSRRPFDEIAYFKSEYGFCGDIILGEIGFVSYPGDDHFMQEITAYDEYLQNYPEIGYGAIFEYGDWNSGRANIQTSSDQLTSYLAANPFTKWELGGIPVIPGSGLEEKIFNLSQSWAFPVNEEAALQKKALADGYTPSGVEEWHEVEAIEYAMQPFYKIGDTNDKRSYYAAVPEWGNVKWTNGENDPLPSEFRFTHWPTPHRVVTQEFLANPDNYEQFGLPAHEGIDIRAYHGDPITAVAEGVISQVNNNPSASNYGIYIRVRHVGDYETTYAHLKEAVRMVGESVHGGDIIGLADNTGNSSGDHLHLTLKQVGTVFTDRCGNVWPYNICDPTPYLIPFSGVSWPGGEPGFPCESEDGDRFNITDWLVGTNGQQFDMEYGSGTQTTMVHHQNGNEFLYVKGSNGEYERLWVEEYQGENWIFRADDTSESPTRMYAHYESQGGKLGAPWIPCNPVIGRWYDTHKYVQHYLKDGCVPQNGGQVMDRIRLMSLPYTRHYSMTGQELWVITLQWSSGEEYDFDGGNVGFRDATRNFEFMGWLEGRSPLPITKYPCFGW